MPKVLTAVEPSAKSARHDPLAEPSRNANKAGKAKPASAVKGPHRRESKDPASSTSAKHQPRASKTTSTVKQPQSAAPTTTGEQRGPTAVTETKIATRQTLPSTKSNYLVQTRLDVDDPIVSRFMSLAPDMTFAEVHKAIQVAFNWADCHMHSFFVFLSDFKGMMMGARPCGPDALKMTIQPSMAFVDEMDDCPTVDEEKITLEQVYENPEYSGKVMIGYEYDSGDSWGAFLRYPCATLVPL